MKFGFDHIHLIGWDLDGSERFYQAMFGAETIGRRHRQLADAAGGGAPVDAWRARIEVCSATFRRRIQGRD